VEKTSPSLCFLLADYWADEVPSSVTSVNFYQTKRRHIPEHNTLHNHHPEYLTSNSLFRKILVFVGRYRRFGVTCQSVG
jgi:hypothetical protein